MNRSALCTLAALAAFGFSGCGKDEPPPVAQKAAPPPPPELAIKIGHVAPLTGNIAHLGKDNEYGARLAVEEINAKGVMIEGRKLKIELIGEDDQAAEKTSTVVAQKLVDAKVNGVVGHLNSGTTIPASRIYADAGIPQISPSATNPEYTQQGFKTAFRVMANDIQQGKVLGEFAVHKLGAKTVAIIDDRTAYGKGLANEVEKAAKEAGAKIVAREFTKNDATDFRAILTKIKGTRPDAVFYGGMDAQAGPMAKQMKQLGVKAKFMSGDGGCTPEFIKLAGDAAEGFYCTQAGLPLERMTDKSFAERFKKRFNVEVQIYSPYSYDAVGVLVDAMKRAKSVDPAKYIAELPKTSYPGLTGRIEFDDKGDIKNGAITMYETKEGKLNVLDVVGGEAAARVPAPAAADAGKAADASKTEAADAAKK
jgi:branched-chain amino acid transport system substrate-binding protein